MTSGHPILKSKLSLLERYERAMEGAFGNGSLCPVLSTDRLRLRMPHPDDIDFLVELDTDQAVMKHINDGPMSASQARLYAETIIELAPRRAHLHRWTIEHLDGTGRLGWIELSKYRGERKRADLSDDIQLAYELSPAAWGCGYTTEAGHAGLKHAFETLKRLDRVVAYVRPDNLRSVRVLEKLRFIPDGVCRNEMARAYSFYVLPIERWRESYAG